MSRTALTAPKCLKDVLSKETSEKIVEDKAMQSIQIRVVLMILLILFRLLCMHNDARHSLKLKTNKRKRYLLRMTLRDTTRYLLPINSYVSVLEEFNHTSNR